MKQKVKKFQQLLNVVKDMELSELAAISTKKEKLMSEVEELRIAKSLAHKDAVLGFDSSTTNSHRNFEKWSAWIDLEIISRLEEMTKIAATLEEQKKRSQIALGRVNAFKKIAERKG